MRLFIAINFDTEIISHLRRFQGNLKRNGMEGNFSPKENLHLTLAFIGEYAYPDAVLEAMEEVDFEAFDIELQGVGSFGDLYWAGIAENEELNAYVKRLRRALAEHDIPYDRKKFSPHITLVRRAVFRNRHVLEVTNPPKGSMKAERVSLMRSDRGKRGMIYTEIGAVDASDS